MTDRQSAAHILRRLTFGPTAPEVDRAVKDGVPTLLAPVPPPAPPDLGPDPLGALPKGASREDRIKARQAANDQVGTLTRWWLARMAAPGAAEKLTFFWHGHWATSVQKVKSAQLMLAQQQAFRRYGPGDTGAFVRAMLRDPALIIWLDGQKNTAKAPNENLARELMELFTLGVGNYTEDDVKAGARALTGWVVDRSTGAARFLPKRHSPGAPDADAHADSLVRNPAHARFIATRLWVRYGSGAAPSAATAQRLVSAFGPGRDVTAMLAALTADPEFPATDGQLVKQPVEWLLGATRQLGIDPAKIPVAALRALGQVLFRPPSVGGWPVGEAWLTTSATQARLKYGQGLAVLAPAAVQTLTEAAKADRLDALGRLLVVDKWTDRTAAVLAPAAAKPQRLLALGLATPEYAVH